MNVGGTYNPSAKHLPSAIAIFKMKYPDTKITFLTCPKAEIEKLLEARKVDIAIIQTPFKSAHLVMEPFAVDSLTLFSHPRHPLANKKKLDLSDLNHSAVVIRAGKGTTERFVEKLKARGIILNVSLRLRLARGGKGSGAQRNGYRDLISQSGRRRTQEKRVQNPKV